MTPQEAAKIANTFGERFDKIEEFILTASTRQLQGFIHLIPAHDNIRAFQLARISLNIRLAEDAANTAQKLSQQTEQLVHHSENLTHQTDRLVRETVKLTGFTKWVFWFTVAIAIFAAIQIALMFFEAFHQYQKSPASQQSAVAGVKERSTQTNQTGQ